MSKEFIPYKAAKKLKELGFDNVPCMAVYTKSTHMNDIETSFRETQADAQKGFVDGILVPLFQQAFIWIADKYDLYCDVSPRTGAMDKEFFFITNIFTIKQNDKYYDTKHYYDNTKQSQYYNVYQARVEGLRRMLEIITNEEL